MAGHATVLERRLSLKTGFSVATTERVRPQEANQVALGLATLLRGGRYEITIEC